MRVARGGGGRHSHATCRSWRTRIVPPAAATGSSATHCYCSTPASPSSPSSDAAACERVHQRLADAWGEVARLASDQAGCGELSLDSHQHRDATQPQRKHVAKSSQVDGNGTRGSSDDGTRTGTGDQHRDRHRDRCRDLTATLPPRASFASSCLQAYVCVRACVHTCVDGGSAHTGSAHTAYMQQGSVRETDRRRPQAINTLSRMRVVSLSN